MKEVYYVRRDKDRREISEQGTLLFPCDVYDRELSQYISGEVPPHWHHALEIFWLKEGNAHISFADFGTDLRPRDICFINSDVLHGVSCPAGELCHFQSIVFEPAVISGAPGSIFDLRYVHPFIESGCHELTLRSDDPMRKDFIHLFEEAFNACTRKQDGYEFYARDALSRILILLRERSDKAPEKPPGRHELRVKEMISWLDDHYAEPVTASRLAAVAGICVRECQRSFSKTLHMTPMQYLLHRRIAAAADYLARTDLPVSEISSLCGFDTPSYFTKQFKAAVGMTPRDYRKNQTDIF